jgi:hypothetical protein
VLLSSTTARLQPATDAAVSTLLKIAVDTNAPGVQTYSDFPGPCRFCVERREIFGKALAVLIRRVCRSCSEDAYFEGNEIIPHWFGEIVDAEWAESTTHSPVAGLNRIDIASVSSNRSLIAR